MRLALAVVALAFSFAAQSKDWSLDAKASHLKFSGSQQGESFSGEFTRFAPRIALDPAKPAETKIEVEIDLGSANSRNKERDDTLATPDFFWTAKYPKAHFRTLACKSAAPGRYECDAELTIRDKTRKLAFPFTFAESGGKATLKAEVELDRTQYDVGTGDWADDGTVGHKVKVGVDLTLL